MAILTIEQNNSIVINLWAHRLRVIFSKFFFLFKALDLSENDTSALIARSKCYLLLGKPHEALQDAEKVLESKSNNCNIAKAMYYKAEALYYLGDYEMSLVFYHRGMRIRPEFTQFRLGVQKAKEAIRHTLGN